jgi:hypothetical protein
MWRNRKDQRLPTTKAYPQTICGIDISQTMDNLSSRYHVYTSDQYYNVITYKYEAMSLQV